MDSKDGLITGQLRKMALRKVNDLDQAFFAACFGYGLVKIFGIFKTCKILWRIYARIRKQKSTLPGV